MNRESVRILVIEDDPSQLRLVQAYLERSRDCEYDLVACNSVSAGLAQLAESEFDVVLLDLGLPDSQGLETFHSIHSGAPNVPIVIHSALSDQAIAIDAVKQGAQDYLVKGQTSGEVMTRALNYAIERTRISEQLRCALEQLQSAHEQLKTSQEQLIQAEKMSAVGTMVAGVAHELNNPLTGIIQFARYCSKYTDADDRRYPILQDIIHEGQRCAEIVRSLLTFSAMGDPDELESQDCNLILDRVLNLLGHRIEKENVTITRDITEPLPRIQVKVNEIQQVFLNLITNALDAMRFSDSKEIHIKVRSTGDFIRFTISDTGPGIPGENLTKVFDPFFTTKPPGQGTGLGLTVTRNTVSFHGGDITIDSDCDSGTQVTVTLPTV